MAIACAMGRGGRWMSGAGRLGGTADTRRRRRRVQRPDPSRSAVRPYVTQAGGVSEHTPRPGQGGSPAGSLAGWQLPRGLPGNYMSTAHLDKCCYLTHLTLPFGSRQQRSRPAARRPGRSLESCRPPRSRVMARGLHGCHVDPHARTPVLSSPSFILSPLSRYTRLAPSNLASSPRVRATSRFPIARGLGKAHGRGDRGRGSRGGIVRAAVKG